MVLLILQLVNEKESKYLILNLFIPKINSEKNEIIVGPRDSLGKKVINLDNLNLLVDKTELKKNICKSKIYWKTLTAKIDIQNQNNAEVNLKISEDEFQFVSMCFL